MVNSFNACECSPLFTLWRKWQESRIRHGQFELILKGPPCKAVRPDRHLSLCWPTPQTAKQND
ncbi:hypothetical cytosolic protein [Syntrophus aciditrophicus SB]|uniref:Hypothetical cytosolic protein n=1 Tax=Syntrophus aciditrophicus (strain SB) TaxID=56780 RepID=Q2LPN3_SYNAS|nr:hypothetical cytosolic protein [Syntrophus aciditrophicus SB]